MADIILPITAQVTIDPATLAQEQEKLLKAFNVAVKPGVPNFDVMRQMANQMSPTELGQLRAQSPAFARQQEAYNRFAQTGQTDQQAKQAAKDLADAQKQATQASKQALQASKQADQQVRQQQQQDAAQLRQQRQAELQLLRQSNQQRQQAAHSLRSTYGAFSVAHQAALFATGGGRGSAMSLVNSVLAIGMQASLSRPATAASTASTGVAGQAAAGAAGGAAQALGSATGNAAGASIVNALGKLAGPAAIAAAIGLVANEQSAALVTTEQNLRASDMGTPGGTMLSRTFQAARRYATNPADVAALYQQLGTQGVAGRNVQGTAADVLAFSHITGLDQKTVGQFAGALATGGKMTPDQIGQVFDAVVRGANLVGLSMTTLADTLTSFTKATGNTALGVRGQMSVLALQGALGNTMSATVAAPLQNAFGVAALKLGGFMNMSPTQMQHLQAGGGAGISELFRDYGQALQRAVGKSGSLAQRTDIAAAINQQIGGVDTSGLGFSEQQQLFRLLLTNPGQAAQQYQRLTAQIHPNANGMRAVGAGIAGAEAPVLQKAMIDLQTKADDYLKRIADTIDQVEKDLKVGNLPKAAGDALNFGGLGFVPSGPNGGFNTPLDRAIAGLWNDITGLFGTAHSAPASGSASINPATGMPYMGGGGPGATQLNPVTGKPYPGANYAPKKTLNQQYYQSAVALNQAMPSIPWQVFYAWAQAEGANAAYDNPLNISYAPKNPALAKYKEYKAFTSTGPGATAIGGFPTLDAGAAATAALLQREYPGIMQAAQTGNVAQIMTAIQNSPWAPGQYGHLIQDIFSQTFRQTQGGTNVTITVVDKTKGGINATVAPAVASLSSRIGTPTHIQEGRQPMGRPAYAPTTRRNPPHP